MKWMRVALFISVVFYLAHPEEANRAGAAVAPITSFTPVYVRVERMGADETNLYQMAQFHAKPCGLECRGLKEVWSHDQGRSAVEAWSFVSDDKRSLYVVVTGTSFTYRQQATRHDDRFVIYVWRIGGESFRVDEYNWIQWQSGAADQAISKQDVARASELRREVLREASRF